MCDFEQDKNDKFIWTRRKGAGASNYTEPFFDHTTGSTTGEPYTQLLIPLSKSAKQRELQYN